MDGGTNWVVVASSVVVGVEGLGLGEALGVGVPEGWPVTVASSVGEAVSPRAGGTTDSAINPAP